MVEANNSMSHNSNMCDADTIKVNSYRILWSGNITLFYSFWHHPINISTLTEHVAEEDNVKYWYDMHSRDKTVLIDLLWFNVVHYSSLF